MTLHRAIINVFIQVIFQGLTFMKISYITDTHPPKAMSKKIFTIKICDTPSHFT